MFNVFSVVEEEAAEEIIEEDVYDDEVEPEDGESHEETKLKTQEKDLVIWKRVKNYFQHCSNHEIATLCHWCY